jgi:cation:H+ antiporter
LNAKAYSYNDIFNIVLGLVIVFAASNVIVDKTLYFADIFSISAFYISLIVISLGTNLPELSLAVRSVLSGKNDVAMGDYIGSAASNTFLFGLFTLMHNGEILTVSNFFITFFFIVTSVICFYLLFLSQNGISRRSGIALLCLYIVFVILELV